MHRAIGRCIRGTCRKWRENDCPAAAGEEVRKNKDGKKKEFMPPKYTWEEAVTWTSALVLGYQLTHRRRRQVLFGERHSLLPTASESCIFHHKSSKLDQDASSKTCPFSLSSKVFTQPIFKGASTSSLNVKSRNTSAVIQSIDVAPFIQEDLSADPSELFDRVDGERLTSISEDEDDGIIFEPEEDASDGPALRTDNINNILGKTSLSQSLPLNIDSSAEHGKKFGGDLLSVLGSFEFLKAEADATGAKTAAETESPSKKKLRKRFNSKNGVFGKSPPIHALDLIKRGTELGSGRAFYNLGVAYDRMKDITHAKEYYKKAADLGHPLATYNCAVLALNDGQLTEGYALMKTASEFGVSEAKDFMNPTDENLTLPFRDLQVGKA